MSPDTLELVKLLMSAGGLSLGALGTALGIRAAMRDARRHKQDLAEHEVLARTQLGTVLSLAGQLPTSASRLSLSDAAESLAALRQAATDSARAAAAAYPPSASALGELVLRIEVINSALRDTDDSRPGQIRLVHSLISVYVSAWTAGLNLLSGRRLDSTSEAWVAARVADLRARIDSLGEAERQLIDLEWQEVRQLMEQVKQLLPPGAKV